MTNGDGEEAGEGVGATPDASEPPRSVRVDGIAGLAPTPQRRELRRLAKAMRG